MSTDFSTINKAIVVASHPRSGTHLTIDLLRKQFDICAAKKRLGAPLDRLYLALEALTAPNQPLAEKTALEILQKTSRPLIKTHADVNLSHLTSDFSNWQRWLQSKGDYIYVFRDGRDVICSLHLFMQSYDPTTRCSLSEFIRQQVGKKSRIKIWAEHVNQWLSQPNIYPLRFEDIIGNPSETLDKLGHFLQIQPRYIQPILPKPHKGLWQGRIARLTQTQPESSAILGYYGGQKAEKWNQSFTIKDRHFFHQEAGDLLLKLGYEASDSWITS